MTTTAIRTDEVQPAQDARLGQWDDAIRGFAVYCDTQGRHASTVAGHRRYLLRLAEAHPQGPAAVTEADFEAWAAAQPTGTLRNAWVACRRFYGWAVAVELVNSSPVGIYRRRGERSPYAYVETMPTSWRSATEEHLDRLNAKGLRPGSVYLTLHYLRRFAALHPNPWVVEPGDIARWLAMHGWKAATQRSALKSLRSFYRHAIQSGRTRTSPADNLDQPRLPRAVPRPAQEVVIARALRDADHRTRLMILLGAFAGLRSAEIAVVHLGKDIDRGQLLVHGKGGHERRVPLHPVLAYELERECERRRAGEYGSGFDTRYAHHAESWLFPGQLGDRRPVSSNHVSKLISRALPDGVTAHMLRHRFATMAYSGGDIRAVQELMGHANITTTQGYTQARHSALVGAVHGLPSSWDVHRPSEPATAEDRAEWDGWTDLTTDQAGDASCPGWCLVEHPAEDGSDLHSSRTLATLEGLSFLLQQERTPGARPGLVLSTSQDSIRLDATPELLRGLVDGVPGLSGLAELTQPGT